MKRILSKYGAYTNHLASLSESKPVKSADRSKLKGCYQRWTDAKYLLECVVFVDLLSPCVILSKVMQHDYLDILEALTAVLRAVREMEKLSALDLDHWPTYALTVEKCAVEDGKMTYQCQELKNFVGVKAYYAGHYVEYCSKVY